MKDAIDQIEMPPGFRILFRMSKQFYRDVTYALDHCAEILMRLRPFMILCGDRN